MFEYFGEEMFEIKGNFNWSFNYVLNVFVYYLDVNYERILVGCFEYIGNLFFFLYIGMLLGIKFVIRFCMGIQCKLEFMSRVYFKEVVIMFVGEVLVVLMDDIGEIGFNFISLIIIYFKEQDCGIEIFWCDNDIVLRRDFFQNMFEVQFLIY